MNETGEDIPIAVGRFINRRGVWIYAPPVDCEDSYHERSEKENDGSRSAQELKTLTTIDLSRYGDREKCFRTLEESRREVMELLSGVDDVCFARLPDSDRWSVALILEHIALSERSVGRVIARLRRAVQGEELPSIRREPGRRWRPDGRAIAPEVVSPRGNLSRDDVMTMLAVNRECLLQEAEESRDLLDEPVTFPHPFFGELTGLGWLRMAAFHEGHHLPQLRQAAEE